MKEKCTIFALILGSVYCASSLAAPVFSSTTAAMGGVDSVWNVATEHGGYNDGKSRFDSIFANVSFGSAYGWTKYGTASTLANNPSGSNGGIGHYIYFIFSQTFDLSGYDASSATLKFKWGADDVPGAVGWTPAFSLNDGAIQGGGTSGAYALGGETMLTSGFKDGLNTLYFYVEGNGQTDGFALQTLSFTADPQNRIPEPASLALIAMGLAALVGIKHRK